MVEGLYAANGLVVSSYGDCLVRLCMARAKVKNLDKLVRASAKDLRSVLYKQSVCMRSSMLSPQILTGLQHVFSTGPSCSIIAKGLVLPCLST